MKDCKEECYIKKRLLKAGIQSILFYFFRIFPIKDKRIVVTTIEGTTGFSCNPKYIVLELLKRNENLPSDERWEIYWLVNDTDKKFPGGVYKIKNTLYNRAYLLCTARFWIDNSRKQLECRKRKGQIYIQTWHAKLGFKPTCLDRGASFSKIAYLVSKHDSDMVDYWLSNSDWYDRTLKTGSLYEGKTLRTGSPRCDILVNRTESDKKRVRRQLKIPDDAKLIMYAPTFRGGSQSVDRTISYETGGLDYPGLINALKMQFGGEWYVLLRLHPQLVARHIESNDKNERLIDISKADDMYEFLAGCDAFLSDYSSAVFDAAAMRIPIFLYCSDLEAYEKERGLLLWDMKRLPFPVAENLGQLESYIKTFDATCYQKKLEAFFLSTEMSEDGKASSNVVSFMEKLLQ